MSWWRPFRAAVPPPLPRFPGPASNPFAPGGCGTPMSAASEAYEFMVIGIANPFALRWVPPNTIITVDGVPAQAGQIFPLGRTLPLPSAEGFIHPGDGGRKAAGTSSDWHHISIGVTGEAIFAGAPPANASVVASQGNRSTMLKARVTLSMGNSRTRTFDIDIGAGVEMDVRCRGVVSIEALVPDPTSLDDVPFPAALGEGVSAFTFAASVVATVYCGCCPQGYKMPVTYSQPFFVVGGALGATMPIVSDAREVEIFASDPGADPAPAVTAQFAYVPAPVEAANTLPIDFAPMGTVVSPPGETSTRRVVIPGNANALLLARGSESDGTTINVVQLLNV